MNPRELSARLRTLALTSQESGSECGLRDRSGLADGCPCERVIACSEALACLRTRDPGDETFEPAGDEPADLTAWLEALASIERASVKALDALAERLMERGAPAHLIDAARAAAAEMRHETWRA